MNDRIFRAREAEKILRLRFEAEKQAEWMRVSSQARNEVENAVWEAYTSGTPVTQIAAQYGTKNRGTIYEIINRRKQFETFAPEVVKPADVSWMVEPIEYKEHYGPEQVYRVQTERTWTHGAHTATLYITPESQGLRGLVIPEGPVFLDRPATTPLHSELRDNWDTSPIAARIKELEANA